ncbi:5-formyltetrahydrofolate cyclo-ligase [Myceligenerans halotolerans]
MTAPGIDAAKAALRRQVWDDLAASGAAPSDVHGRIPDFTGADDAADSLARCEPWQRSRVVKIVPDTPQQPVRALALRAGKLVYMAIPRLAEPEPFILLDPATLPVSPDVAADRHEAVRFARRVDVDRMRPVDLVVTGSVAVNIAGARIGKGAGYGDIEVAILAEAGLIGTETVISTTVHDLQVLDTDIPESAHDFHVDLIVTPTRVIETTVRKRPSGIDWNHMPESKIQNIPALAARRSKEL